MAHRILQLANEPERARDMGAAGRRRVEASFSMQAMVQNYQYVYDMQLQRTRSR
jgi:glycosyltransferase involved in cell wall biosynthesis